MIFEGKRTTLKVVFNDDYGVCGSVYEVLEVSNDGGDSYNYEYASKSSPDYYDCINDDCRIMFDFSFCYRGVWEGRIYFKDSEYWGGELQDMNDAWNYMQDAFKKLIMINENMDTSTWDD